MKMMYTNMKEINILMLFNHTAVKKMTVNKKMNFFWNKVITMYLPCGKFPSMYFSTWMYMYMKYMYSMYFSTSLPAMIKP